MHLFCRSGAGSLLSRRGALVYLERAHERVIEKNFPNAPFKIYTFRHAYGTRQLQAGKELPVLVSNVRP